MTAVVAARWDVTWDRGAGWQVRLGRRTRSGDVLPLAGPAALEVRPVDAPTTTTPLLTGTGVIGTDGAYVEVTLTREQIEALTHAALEYRVTVVDAARSLPLVLLRGYAKIRDTVGDD